MTQRTDISCITTRMSRMRWAAHRAIYMMMVLTMTTMKFHLSWIRTSETLTLLWRMDAAGNAWRPFQKLANHVSARCLDCRGELRYLAMDASIVRVRAVIQLISAEIRDKKSKTDWKRNHPLFLAPLRLATNILPRDSDCWIVTMRSCSCRMNTTTGIVQESISMSTYFKR